MQVFERHEREIGQKTACLIAAGSSQITRAGEQIPDSGFCLNYPSGKMLIGRTWAWRVIGNKPWSNHILFIGLVFMLEVKLKSSAKVTGEKQRFPPRNMYTTLEAFRVTLQSTRLDHCFYGDNSGQLHLTRFLFCLWHVHRSSNCKIVCWKLPRRWSIFSGRKQVRLNQDLCKSWEYAVLPGPEQKDAITARMQM